MSTCRSSADRRLRPAGCAKADLWAGPREYGSRPDDSFAGSGTEKGNPSGRFLPQCHFRTIHSVDAGVPAGSTERRFNTVAGEEAEHHQLPGVFERKIDRLENGFGPFGQLG